MKSVWAKRNMWILPIVGIVGFILTLYSVLSRPVEKVKHSVEMNTPIMYESVIAGIGVIEPASENITLGVELPGIVRDIPVHEGQTVKKHDILFRLDQRDIDAKISELQAQLEVAKIAAEQSSVKFGLVEHISDKRAVSADDYNDRSFNKQLGQATVSQIQTSIEQSKITKERLIVRAPIDCTVIDINIHTGEYASNNGFVLMRIGDLTTMNVRVEIDEEAVTKLKPYARAYGLVRGDVNSKIPLEFVRLDSFIQPKTNIAVEPQRVDTRVLHIIYQITSNPGVYVGQQMDVYIEKAV